MATVIQKLRIHGKTLYFPYVPFDCRQGNMGKSFRWGLVYLAIIQDGVKVYEYMPFTIDELNSLGAMLTNDPAMNVNSVPYEPDPQSTGLQFYYAACAISVDYADTINYVHPFIKRDHNLLLESKDASYQHPSTGTIYVKKNGILNVGTNVFNITWVNRADSPGAELIANEACLIDFSTNKFTFDGEIVNMQYILGKGFPSSVDDINNNINDYLSNYDGDPEDLPQITGVDSDNPYGQTVDGTSTWGGGGLNDIDPDEVDPALIPSLPSLSACNTGFITVYNPSVSQLKQLSEYLWNSNMFDVEQWQKLFADPMEGVIGLTMVPVSPSTGGAIPVMIGNATTNISMPIVASQFVEVDCGSVTIDKYVNCFLDYIQTKISIYLPYIGMRDLNAQDVMDDSIHVIYHVDVITGACTCMIATANKGVLYSFNGNCACDIPLNANNFSGAIQNAISTVISAAATIGGAVSGAAPITMAGAAGLLNSASNAAINTKPHIQRSGNMGGSSGLLSIQKPYVIIERPRVSVPDGINGFVGNTSNITLRLGSCNGFTMVDYIHLNGFSASSNELKEIEALLKEGVIL